MRLKTRTIKRNKDLECRLFFRVEPIVINCKRIGARKQIPLHRIIDSTLKNEKLTVRTETDRPPAW